MGGFHRIPSMAAIALLATLLSAPASAQVPDYVSAAPGATEYPDDDGLILRQVVRITLGKDGRVERHVEESWKMLTAYLTRHDYFDPRIDWNDARATQLVDQARTYMADGTIVDAKPNSQVPNTAAAFQWAVPYAHMRQLTVAHVGVEHDATAVLAYTIQDRAPVDDPFWGVVELQSFLPILDQWITLEVPEGTPLTFGGVNCELTAKRESLNGMTSFVLHRADVPALNLSENGWDHGVAQRLAYSSAADWTGVRNHLARSIEAAAMLEGAVAAKVDEVLDGATLAEDKVARIHAFVVDGIRTIDWPVADFDYVVRPATDVLDSSVGHPLDKAVLLTAMLRAAGLDAHVALASDSAAVSAVVAAPGQLDRVWVRVTVGSTQQWLDPSANRDDRNRWDLAGRPVLLLDAAAPGLEWRPELTSADNRASLKADITLEVDGDALIVSGTADVDLAHTYNPLAGFDRSSDRHAKLAGGVAAGFGGAEVDEVFVARHGCKLSSLRVEFSGGTIDVPDHGLVQLALPRVPGALSGGEFGSYRATRTLPVWLPDGAASERVELTIALPAGFDVVHVPDDLALAGNAGSVRRSATVTDGELHWSTVLVINRAEVAPEDYAGLRSLLDGLESSSAATVLLRRTE